MTKLRTALFALLTIAGCDFCEVSTDIHRDRCSQGMTDSCEWLDAHATAAGTCH